MVLVNGYFDLGTWWCVTPFIGAGVGVAHNRIEHFRDTERHRWRRRLGRRRDQVQLRLGRCMPALSYKVTSNFAIDLAYRYLNLGKAETGLLVEPRSDRLQRQSIEPGDVQQHQSHDLKLGMRWLLQSEPPPAYPPPLMRKG